MTERPPAPRPQATEAGWIPPAPRAAALLDHLARVWPARTPSRPVAGLPPAAADALRGPRHSAPYRRAAQALDRAAPGWPETAASLIADTAPAGLSPLLTRLCSLLAHRPLARPEPLLRLLGRPHLDPEAALWALVALSGTDTPAVRAVWLDHLRARVAADPPRPDSAAWFAFARAALAHWLSWPDFRECLTRGRLLPSDPGATYRPALERLGLWADATFAKWYREVVYEAAAQPDVALSLEAAGWIRDFPGEPYLWDALAGLDEQPDSWWPLYVLRWVSGVDPADEQVRARLAEFSGPSLCLLSLLRPDLSAAAAPALGAPRHEAVIRWLRSCGPTAPLDRRWVEAVLRPWAAAAGEAYTIAVGSLCALEPPPDFSDDPDPRARRRAFLRSHLLPTFDRVVDTLFYVHAARGRHLDVVCASAARGRPTAIRCLALCPDRAAEVAPVLFRLAREGAQQARAAALAALTTLREHLGLQDLDHLQRRLDLASAWADSGLEGRPARIWWDLASHRLKLSVADGRVTLQAFSGCRRLNSLPAAVRADPAYAEVRRARAELQRSYRYFRRRLEAAMVEGHRFSGRELGLLLRNPIVRSLLSRLILLADDEPYLWQAADPLEESPPDAVTRAAFVSIAHPVGLLCRSALDHWQERIASAHIPQPFKQAFREIYLLGEGEGQALECPRFSGRPLIARRAFALLRARGYSPRRGVALKEWPRAGLRAHLRWAAPGEDAGRLLADEQAVESVTSGSLWFARDDGTPLPLGAVPPVVLSETLRDADLVASRAAAGELGFSSEETLRMRAAIVRYLARALGLTNIYVSDDSPHVLIEGRRDTYRVHLGSGSVLLESSRRSLDLGAVRSQQLETLVSESMDSTTSRIIAIIGALAHDHQISDPAFLRQLRPPDPEERRHA